MVHSTLDIPKADLFSSRLPEVCHMLNSAMKKY